MIFRALPKHCFAPILAKFSVGQTWISETVSKGGPFGSAGGRITEEGGASEPPPPPKSAPVIGYVSDCV